MLILVKAWEPPLMEFVDFVKALRTKISAESAEIVVLPVGLEPAVAGLGRATPVWWLAPLGRSSQGPVGITPIQTKRAPWDSDRVRRKNAVGAAQ